MGHCRGQSLFPSFIAALKAKPGTDEEFKKQGVLVQAKPHAHCPSACTVAAVPGLTGGSVAHEAVKVHLGI